MSPRNLLALVILAVVALGGLWLARQSGVGTDAPDSSTSSGQRTDEAPPRQASAETKFEIRTRGIAIDPNGFPVGEATVEAWTPRENVEAERRCRNRAPVRASAVTDRQGNFTLEWSEEEQYCVRARHPLWSNSDPLLVSTGENAQESLRLVLQRHLQVQGRVIDARGTAVTGAKLSLARRDGPASEQREAVADAEGRFLFDRLDSGEFDLTSADPTYAVSRPREIVLSSGSLDGMVVRLDAVTMITGRLLDAKGQPVANVDVVARSPFDQDLELGRTRSRSDGTFELPGESRSEAAHMAQRMQAGGLVDKSGRERIDLSLAPSPLCIGFQHAELQAQSIYIAETGTTHPLGTLYMQPRATLASRSAASRSDSRCGAPK